ncbi:hypothetical protein DPMN_082484 [Dreissena polymorpha]|uniref:Uncharacterized protein n=1 Tax=Dreissena polymorpha TaxID=45954 RepID=A0A9D3YA51_DREPO|nr:hypothetical protein DPMN_082484 [Dreissena polymorpha]
MAMGQVPSTTPPPYIYPRCAPRNTTILAPYLQSNGTVLPAVPTFPDTFQVRVEANILEMNKTIVGEEFHDMNKRAALRTITNNSENYMILDYYNGQLFYDVNSYRLNRSRIKLDAGNKEQNSNKGENVNHLMCV